MSAANWYPDPTGRHVQRYFDGQRWTPHVAGADGVQSQDPVPVDPSVPAPAAPPTAAAPPPQQAHPQQAVAPPPQAAPPPQHAPPPQAAPPPQQPPPPQQNWSPPQQGQASTATSAGSGSSGGAIGAGLIVSAIGAIATLLAMLVLDWIDVGFAFDRADIGDVISDDSGLADFTVVSELFFSFGWIVVLVAAIAALLVPFVPPLKLPVALVCAIGTAWVLFTLFDITENVDELAIGAWVAVAGPAVAAVGALISKPASR
ncbi:MAG: DUF2510 domain-containing protein [Acidimicrobiales bacterium]